MTDLISREAALALFQPENSMVRKHICDDIRALPAVTPATVGVPTDCRRWTYYPIQMPFTKDGKGPATICVDAESISYEVWDCVCNSYASFDNLPDAINEAMRLSIAALTPPPVDASQTPDPVLSDPRVEALVEKMRDWEARIEDCEWSANSSLTEDIRAEMRAALHAIEGEK